jgi:hypothetical protein
MTLLLLSDYTIHEMQLLSLEAQERGLREKKRITPIIVHFSLDRTPLLKGKNKRSKSSTEFLRNK